MPRCLVVLVTCPTRAVARRIATALVTRRLAACVNVMPVVHSIYRWQGKVERAQEALLLIKTSTRRFAQAKRVVLALHPYEVPEVVALRLVDGHPAYLRWVATSVS